MLLTALRRSLILSAVFVSTASAQIVGANADSIPNDSWVDGYFRGYDAGARAAHLVPLREMSLRSGEREVRVWTQVELGEPKHLYRLTQAKGRVHGERIEYWSTTRALPNERPGETWNDLILYGLRGRCGDYTTFAQTSACRVRFVKDPSWERVLRAAEAQGLWTLPDPSVLPRENIVSFDGWTMAVELRDGPRYRTYSYHNPGSHPAWPSDSQANAIVGVLGAIDSLVHPAEIYKVYRGLTTGRYESAFRSCDGDDTWELRDGLRSLLERASPEVRAAAPRELSDSTQRDSTLYEVEVAGTLTPEWLARRWESKFSRVLEPYELRSVRLATAPTCAKGR